MVVASILPYGGPNDHRKDAPPFIKYYKIENEKDLVLSEAENSRDVEKRSQERRERSS